MSSGPSFWLGFVLGTVLAVILTLIAVRHVIAWYRRENTNLRLENAILRPRREARDRRRTVIPIQDPGR